LSELRHDPVQRRWVIIATDRGRRPSDFARNGAPPAENGACVFCPGNEAATPPEIAALRQGAGGAGGPGWRVRVVPNKFPALEGGGDPEIAGSGLYLRMQGAGAHEVIIETPDHAADLSSMPGRALEEVLGIYRERLRELLTRQMHKYVLIFRNHGEAAGASLAHPHTQIIATPVTPLQVAEELESSRAHFEKTGRCLFCQVLEHEISDGRRILAADDAFVAFAPYASRFPYEVHLYPRKHSHSFAQESDETVARLASALGGALRRLRGVLGDPPYNFVFHTAPNKELEAGRPGYWQTLEQDYHWHVEILPRLTPIAGFEWGTGLHINPTAPEAAAEALRGAPA